MLKDMLKDMLKGMLKGMPKDLLVAWATRPQALTAADQNGAAMCGPFFWNLTALKLTGRL